MLCILSMADTIGYPWLPHWTTSDSRIIASDPGMTASDTCTSTCRQHVKSVEHTSFYDFTSPQCIMPCALTTPYATIQCDLLTAGQQGHYLELVHLRYQSFYMPSALCLTWPSSRTSCRSPLSADASIHPKLSLDRVLRLAVWDLSKGLLLWRWRFL